MTTAGNLAPNDSDGNAVGTRALPVAKKKNRRPYTILAAIVALGLAGYGLVHVFTVGRESTDDAQIATDMVPIAARVGGVLTVVPVADNQEVKPNDLIAQIDPIEYKNRVEQMEAELRAAQAQSLSAQAQMRIVEASSKGGLSTARAALSGTTATVAGAEAQVEVAQAMLAKAEADAQKADNDLHRAQSLRKDDAIPEAQVDTLRSQAAASHAAVAQAKAQIAAAREAKNNAHSRVGEAAGRLEQTASVDAQVATARANADLAAARVAGAEVALSQARLNLSYTKILAPSAGHVSKLAVHAGQLIQAGQIVTNLLPDSTYVIANFKETQVGRMRPGQDADVEIDAFPGRKFHAKVESVAFGTGAQFSMLPPDNASGNFVKVVQRVPVKLAWAEFPSELHLAAGASADVTVIVK